MTKMPTKDSELQSDMTCRLYQQTRMLYCFASLMTMHGSRNNGAGAVFGLTITEAHLLTDIMTYPGIQVSELGRMYKKTRGAISQMVKKLEQAGLVTKSVNDQHGKRLDLNLTKTGLKAAHMFAAEAVKNQEDVQERLKTTCSAEEIDHFYKVLRQYNKILQELEND